MRFLRNKKLVIILILIVTATIALSLYIFNENKNSAPQENNTTEANIVNEEEFVEEYEPNSEPEEKEVVKEEQPEINEEEPVWPKQLSSEEAKSLQVVVNKKHKLPSDYVPLLKSVSGAQMRPEAATALTNLLTAASDAGSSMKIISSYRSYSTQVSTYNKWVSIQGKAEADRSSARPGHSEHQTGLAVDLGVPSGNCDLLICFGDTSQGEWLASNAHKYGFIVRYPEGKEAETGYQYEPWHMRYLGIDIATKVINSSKTLDQYYSVPAGDY